MKNEYCTYKFRRKQPLPILNYTEGIHRDLIRYINAINIDTNINV